MLNPLRVFICHASQDKPAVRSLHDALVSEGWIDPWVDKAKILPGQDWKLVIKNAVESSDVVVICLSKKSVSREGFIQREIRYAYDIALSKPDNTIFIIPLRLDECEIPQKLEDFQWVDYFGARKKTSYRNLLKALEFRYKQVMQIGKENLPYPKLPSQPTQKSSIRALTYWLLLLLTGIFLLVFASFTVWGLYTFTSQSTPTSIKNILTPPTTPIVNQENLLSSQNEIVTFTDQNNLLAFELPSDWTLEHVDQGDAIYSDVQAYTDTFTSPDGSAKIESLVIFANESVSVTGSFSQDVALDILYTYYSSTGKNNGDIRIKTDQIMKDGSERFEWVSKGGNYTGVSFFEVRGADKRTWLMWTLWWENGSKQPLLDIIDNAINTYYIP